MAALRAAQFKKLELRTRTSLLANLYQDLSALTQQYLGLPEYPTDVSEPAKRAQPSNLIESVKRVLSSKSKVESSSVLTWGQMEVRLGTGVTSWTNVQMLVYEPIL